MGDEKEIPKGFSQWAAYLLGSNHLFLVFVNICALVPIFWLPEHSKTTFCLALGLIYGAMSELFRKIDEETMFDKKVRTWLCGPQAIIGMVFLIVWMCVNQYPAQFLPHWAMGLVIFTGLGFGMGIGSQIRDSWDSDKRQRQQAREYEIRQKQAHAQRALHADIIKLISESESGSICTIRGVESYTSSDPELIKLIKQLKKQ